MVEIADNSAHSQFLGQSGEAASAVRYADDGFQVRIEPANGEFDLRLTNGASSEYVEVKSTRTGLDENHVDTQIAEANDKVARAGAEVTTDNAVLELQLRDEIPPSGEIERIVNSVLETRNAAGIPVNLNEIRVIDDAGNSITIAVDG